MAITDLGDIGRSIVGELNLAPPTGLSSHDNKCCDVAVYYFELRIGQAPNAPQSKASAFIVPLVLNPTSITMSEPFAMEPTLTQGSGLYIERNGIIERSLRIQGHTGWIMQPWQGNAGALDRINATDRNWTRDLLDEPAAKLLSGQKHFQYLQDAVFRIYSQFSKDPVTSPGTSLIFHDPRESEAWVVEPRSFSMMRSSASPLLYNYDIDLLIVDKAANTELKSIDKGVLDTIRSTLSSVGAHVDAARAYIQQLSAAAYSLSQIVSQVDGVIVSAGVIFTAAANFVRGVTSLIASPFSVILALATDLDYLLAAINTARAAGKIIPEAERQALQRLRDSTLALAMHPEVFQSQQSAVMANLKAQQAATNAVLQSTVDAVNARYVAGPSTTAQIEADTMAAVNARPISKVTTALSDADVAYNALQAPYAAPVVAYTGAHPYQVKQGDTLANLAARFLGNASLWGYIAEANGLVPPFAQAQATTPLAAGRSFGGLSSIALGSTIQIPDYSTAPTVAKTAAVIGASPTDSVQLQYLGRDFAVGSDDLDFGDTRIEADSALFDLLIDTEHGAIDVRTAQGSANLAQAVLVRIGTEAGTDTLYPSLGVASLITTDLPGVDTDTTLYAVKRALQQDPRVAQVTSLVATQNGAFDRLVLEGVLQATGIDTPVTLSVPLST